MATASNTRDYCFREALGHRIVGLLFDALPLEDNGLAAGTKALILDDGRALVIHANGSYFIESAERVERAVRRAKTRLEQTTKELSEVLELAGPVGSLVGAES